VAVRLSGARHVEGEHEKARDGERQKKAYKPPDVIFVKQWKEGRTDAEIRAQQKKDQPAERELRRLQAEAEAKYKARMKAIEEALN
jgi:hypothetical protein